MRLFTQCQEKKHAVNYFAGVSGMNHLCPLVAHTDQDGDIMCDMVPIPCLMFDCERWTYKKENDEEVMEKEQGKEEQNC